jgi:hypothetical protein
MNIWQNQKECLLLRHDEEISGSDDDGTRGSGAAGWVRYECGKGGSEG